MRILETEEECKEHGKKMENSTRRNRNRTYFPSQIMREEHPHTQIMREEHPPATILLRCGNITDWKNNTTVHIKQTRPLRGIPFQIIRILQAPADNRRKNM